VLGKDWWLDTLGSGLERGCTISRKRNSHQYKSYISEPRSTSFLSSRYQKIAKTIESIDASSNNAETTTKGQKSKSKHDSTKPFTFNPGTYLPCRFIPYEGNDQSPDTNAQISLNQLCDKCEVLRIPLIYATYDDGITWLEPGEAIPGQIFSHHDTLLNILMSSQAGCHLCSLLFNTGLAYSKKNPHLYMPIITEGQIEIALYLPTNRLFHLIVQLERKGTGLTRLGMKKPPYVWCHTCTWSGCCLNIIGIEIWFSRLLIWTHFNYCFFGATKMGSEDADTLRLASC
jgi:hypothetical protein